MQQGYHGINAAIDTSEISPQEEKEEKFTKCDYFLSFLGGIFPFFSLVIDLGAVAQHAYERHVEYASFTAVFMVAPTILVYWFSWIWAIHDKRHSRTVHVDSVFDIVFRPFKTIVAGRKANNSRKKEDFIELYQCESDACLLSLYSAFLKSAPQAVLQIYITLEDKDCRVFTVLSAGKSILLLAIAVTSYDRDMRRYLSQQREVSWGFEIIQVAWRLCSIGSRTFATVLAARTTNRFTLAGVLLTIVLIAMFVTSLKRLYEVDEEVSKAEDFPHNLALTAAFTFGFVNIHDTGIQSSAALHSYLMIPLNVLPYLDYCQEQAKVGDVWSIYIAGGVLFGGQACGAVLMLIYACCYHPKGGAFLIPYRIIHKKPDHSQGASCRRLQEVLRAIRNSKIFTGLLNNGDGRRSFPVHDSGQDSASSLGSQTAAVASSTAGTSATRDSSPSTTPAAMNESFAALLRSISLDLARLQAKRAGNPESV